MAGERKRVHVQLPSEVRRGLFDAIPDALVIVDEDGQIVLANTTTERLLGYPRSELVGEAVETLVPSSLSAVHREHRARFGSQAAAQRMAARRGLRALRKDGTSIQVDIALSALPSSAGTYTVCTIRDATERARAVEAIEASELRFRTLANQATDGIFLSNAEGRYLDANDAACGMLGYARDELLERSIADILAPDEVERLPVEIARLAGGAAVTSEWIFRRRDGSTFEGEVNARRLPDSHILAVLRDVSERKRGQEERLRAQQFIEAVAKASPSWIYVFDVDELTLRYQNRSILHDLGYGPEDVRITKLEDFQHYLPTDDLGRLTGLVAAWRALRADEVRDDEYHIRAADGSIRTCLGRETVFARHPDGRVRQILGTLDDITERRRVTELAMEQLQESEERFRTLIEDLDVGVLLQDAGDDQIVLSNRAAEEMLGFGPAELGHLSSHTWPYRLLRADGTDYVPDAMPSVIAARTGQPVRSQIVGSFNTVTGACRWLQVTATPRRGAGDGVRHVLVTMTDVTARKTAEDALIAAREEWEHSFNALTDWVSVLDRGGRIVRANRAMRDRFETRGGALLGLDHRVIYEGEGLAGAPDPCASVLAGGPPIEFTTTLTNVPGHFVVSCYPLGGSGGAVHVVRDITKQRLLEEQLRQSQKMQAIGQLAGGVAHDFNNLLTVIIGCSDLAMLDMPPGATAERESIASIRGAADRAALLTRQLLLFGRKGTWEEKRVNVNDVVQHAGQMLRRVIGEDIVIATTLSPRPWATRADPAQLEQVVLNLALNARDAMPNGGTLTVETRNATVTDADCRIDPSLRPGRFVRLAITDTGSGMSPEVRSHLFEPFFTTKGPGKGTGLGLSTVYGIVHQAGGFIAVDSAPGAGSTFAVYLPAVVNHAGESARADEAERGATGSELVLVVEDETAVRKVIARALDSHGFRVIGVGTAAEALSHLEGDTEHAIRLLITDVVMPGVSGGELAERARAIRPGLPVLFMSGYSPDAITQQRLFRSGDQLLQKPFTPGALTRKVREVIDANARARDR